MKTVLVVEDSRAEQRLIVLLLQQSGLKVALADSGESALVWLAENEQPNLIILDIVMPGIGGLDFCRQIRNSDRFKNIPIIFCSSKDQEFDQFWALRQGGNDYITKPFVPNNLVQTVCKHLN